MAIRSVCPSVTLLSKHTRLLSLLSSGACRRGGVTLHKVEVPGVQRGLGWAPKGRKRREKKGKRKGKEREKKKGKEKEGKEVWVTLEV